MKKVLITGSSGVIGKVLTDRINHDLTPFDLTDCDARNYGQLLRAMQGHDAVVHLAWNTKEDNYGTDYFDSENSLMSFNVYRAAVEATVPRVIMASSVHADKFVGRNSSNLLNPYSLPLPDSPYGAGKCSMEALGRYYADSKDLEVVCLRFGGVNTKNIPPAAPYSERQVWLSHRDCANLISRCIDADEIPNSYSIIYGVSRNRDRMHDCANPLDWEPLDGAL